MRSSIDALPALLCLFSLSAWASPPVEGFRALPPDGPGVLSQQADGSYRVQLPDGEEKKQKYCEDHFSPVRGHHLIMRGDWARQELRVPSRGGAVARVEFFDSEGRRIRAPESNIVRPAVQGTHDWEDIDALVTIPEGAVKARACLSIGGVTGGELDFRGVELEALSETSGEGPNVLVILIDTLRSDALGAYGQPLPLSPEIDALADESLFYQKAWTQYTWTVPSVISLFLSQYARTHGWDSSAKKVNDGDFSEMPLDVPTLAEVLKANGYLTESHRANMLTRHGIGVSRGFMVYDAVVGGRGRDQRMLDMARADLARWDADGHPNFLYLHFMGPHTPLWPSEAGQKAAGVDVDFPDAGLTGKEPGADESVESAHQRFKDAYLASILDIDGIVGELLDVLEEEGHADNTLVFLTSDHGELLGEHGLISHGNYVYEPLTSVPLMVRGPGVDAQRVTRRVGQVIDIAPTVLDYLGLDDDVPESWQGTTLLEPTLHDLPVVSERQDVRATTMDGRFKIIENRSTHEYQLGVDLKKDPGEENSLSETVTRMVKLIEWGRLWRDKIPKADETKARAVQMDQAEKDATQEALKALGYVE